MVLVRIIGFEFTLCDADQVIVEGYKSWTFQQSIPLEHILGNSQN